LLRRLALYRRLVALGFVALLLAGVVSCGGVAGSSSNSVSSNGSATPHVVLVVLENKSFTDVIGNASAPYVNSLAQQYSLATNYYANIHPSLGNYFMLTVGDTVTTVGDAYGGTITEDNIVRQLVAANKTWKSYAQSLPSVGFLASGTPPYARNHNPFTYFSDVQGSATQQQNIVPLTQLSADLANNALPDFAFVVPDNFNNGHDCPQGATTCTNDAKMAATDAWLQTYIQPILQNSQFQQNGIMIITWDESEFTDTANGGGHIATLIIGTHVKRGYQSTTFYQHQSVLRMILKQLGITSYPNQAASAPDMDEFFQ
jgi:hypothetical protein